MKLIDLLNKIKNKENIPSEIIFDKGKFEWDTFEHFYKRGDGSDLLELCTIYSTDDLLNMEVESIENDSDIDNIKELYINDKTKSVGEDAIANWTGRNLDITFANKINEILQAVKQIDKRVKKLED